MNWQPIETAPKDGTFYLGWSRFEDFMVVNEPPTCMRGTWTKSGQEWHGAGSAYAETLTHWMPLPPPPESL